MKKIEAIFLDFDGVILESVEVKGWAFGKLFEDHPEHVDKIVAFHHANGGMSRFDKFRYIYKKMLKEPLPEKQFEALCEIIGNPALVQDPRFADRKNRLANRATLTAELEATFATAPTHEWVEKLTARGVPAGPVWSVPEALAHPQLADRGLLQTHRVGPEDLQLVGIGVKLDGIAPKVNLPPPTLGAHTNDILSELGYDTAQISALIKEGAI